MRVGRRGNTRGGLYWRGRSRLRASVFSLRPPVRALIQHPQTLVALLLAGKLLRDSFETLRGFALQRILKKNFSLNNQVVQSALRFFFFGRGSTRRIANPASSERSRRLRVAGSFCRASVDAA